MNVEVANRGAFGSIIVAGLLLLLFWRWFYDTRFLFNFFIFIIGRAAGQSERK